MVALIKTFPCWAPKTKALSLVCEHGGEADQPSFTHHAEDVEDNMNTTQSTQVTTKMEILQKRLAFGSLRGMSVTEVTAFVKYMLLVLMIYT